ncbi:MAG: hypothetical protein L6R36_004862 [Xanthoria steineri]|nr:MAG: hypothetical protein L6R36_004862 [Xanthoria steineri]
MPPSRIAMDLMASGMDPTIHLTIVQASLCTLRRAMDDLSAMRKEHDELLPSLQQGCDPNSLKKHEKLVKDIHNIEEQVKYAPNTIAEFESDIEMLTRHLDDIKHDSDQKSSSTREDKSMEGQGAQRRGTI